MSDVLPNISRGRFFEPIFTYLYTSIYDIYIYIIVDEESQNFIFTRRIARIFRGGGEGACGH